MEFDLTGPGLIKNDITLGEVVGKPLVIVDQNDADIEFDSLTIESNIRVKFEIL